MKSCAAVGVGFQLMVGAWLLALSPSGCGGRAAGDAQTPESVPAAPSIDSAPPATPEPTATETAASSPSSDAPAPKAEDEPRKAPPPDPNAAREIKYVMTPEGLKVEVAGVRFGVSGESKQIARGWGVKISVKAESLDGKEHSLLSPKNGPLAFAAAVFKKGSTEGERIADSREGEGELKISSGSSTTFSRDFPGKGGRVLAIGETLDMEVALWGLGETADDRRPVKQFVHVKMKVENGKPKPTLEPPASAAR